MCAPGSNFPVAKPAPPLFVDPFDDFGAVTSCNRIAHVDYQRFHCKRVAVVFADLLNRRIRNDYHHHVAKFDSLRNLPARANGPSSSTSPFNVSG